MRRLVLAVCALGCGGCKLAQVDPDANYLCEADAGCASGFTCVNNHCLRDGPVAGGGAGGGGANGGGTGGSGGGGAGGGSGDGGCGICPGLTVCGGGGTPNVCALDTRICSEDGWCWEHPRPQGNTLHGVASAGSYVWAVGAAGTILGWNGSVWFRAPSPVTQDLYAVSAGSATDVWAVGEDAVALHFDGVSWSRKPGGLPDEDWYGVYVADDGGTWVVGAQRVASMLPTVARWDGDGGWERVTNFGGVPLTLNSTLRAIHGRSGTDIHAVGSQDCDVHFDGTQWTAVQLAHPANRSVLVEPSGEVWVASLNGAEHFVAGGWSVVTPPPPNGQLLAVGRTSSGTLLWSTFAQELYRYEDGGFVLEFGTPSLFTDVTLAFAEYQDGGAFAVGTAGRIVQRYPDAGWALRSRGAVDPNLRSVYSASRRDGVAVGGAGKLTRDVAGGWNFEYMGAGVSFNDLYSVSGNGPSDYCIVGDNSSGYGGLLCVHGTTMNWEYPIPGKRMDAVWVAPDGGIYIAGEDSLLRRGPGMGFTVLQDAGSRLTAVWGNGAGHIEAVGEGNLWIWGDDGSAFNELPRGGANLYGVWFETPDDVFRVGAQATLTRGSQVLLTGSTADFFGVWGFSRNDVYVVGDAGVLLHVTDAGATREASGTHYALFGVSGNDAGEVFVVGERGTILRKAR